MTMRKRTLGAFVAILAALGVVAGRAQSGAVPQLDFEFTVMATDRVPDLAFVQLKPEARSKVRPVAADFDIIPLRANSQGRSDVYRFQGPAPLRLVRTAGSAETLKVEKVIGTWTGPTWKDRSLIVLMPKTDGDVAVHAFDDGPAAHGVRQVRMLNLSGMPVAGVVGGTSYRVGADIAMSPTLSAAGTTKIGVSFERFGKAVVAFDQSVNVSDNERLLLVFLPPFRPGADVRTRLVRDQVRVAMATE